MIASTLFGQTAWIRFYSFDDVTSNWKLIIIRDGGDAYRRSFTLQTCSVNERRTRTCYSQPPPPYYTHSTADTWHPTLVPKNSGREVPEPTVRRLQTRRMPLWNAWDCFITENLVLPVMYDSVHSVLVKQHGYIQWTNCTKNTLLGN